jgi:hypothetical protein
VSRLARIHAIVRSISWFEEIPKGVSIRLVGVVQLRLQDKGTTDDFQI